MTIETVDVGWCKEITDQGATQIARSSKSLRYLGLMRCDKVRSFYIKDCGFLSEKHSFCTLLTKMTSAISLITELSDARTLFEQQLLSEFLNL